MADMRALIQGFVQRNSHRATPIMDGQSAEARLDRNAELFVENLWNSHHALAVEGSYFVAQTPTPGAGITLTSATGVTYSDTNAILGINNRDSVPSVGGLGRDVILDYIKLIMTAAGTAGTDSHVASRLDIAARVSGATQLVGMNCHGGYPAFDEVAEIRGGAITVAAASNQVRNLGRAEVRKAAAPGYIVGDVIVFKFGTPEGANPQAQTPTTAIYETLYLPPVVIPPGWSWVLNEWMTARSAAQSAEIEVGYIVR